MFQAFPTYEALSTLRLLVVDDQDFDRKMIVSRLREVVPAQATIIETANGEETLGALADAETPFDAILLDMNLPDIHGLELTNMILKRWPDSTIVMITVESDMEKALACLKAGAQDFLIKGEYTNAGLYRAVRYAIERTKSAIDTRRLHMELTHERELSAAQKDFIHLVSHEFRTPITIISSAVQLLAAKAPELYKGAGASQFKKVEQALKRLVGLLDNVLRLSMVEDGKEVFTPSMLDLRAVMATTMEYFDTTRIHYTPPDAAMPYYGDERFIEYAIHNVISNALKYSPSDRPVDIELRTLPSGLEISVRDYGAGMSPETIARVGEKFHRANATSHIEGVGLGVHLAKRFMEYHSGSMIFESTLGEGTTVRLLFPHNAALIDG